MARLFVFDLRTQNAVGFLTSCRYEQHPRRHSYLRYSQGCCKIYEEIKWQQKKVKIKAVLAADPMVQRPDLPNLDRYVRLRQAR